MNENVTVWLSARSVNSWNSPTLWDKYLKGVETILDDYLVKLDEADPVRRKSNRQIGEGEYITEFRNPIIGKTLFGEFSKKTKIKFTIHINKSDVDLYGRDLINIITFYIPKINNGGHDFFRKIELLFSYTVESLGAFSAESDIVNEIYSKKSHDGAALDISTELLGVFWLTFFGGRYAEFFSYEKLESIVGYKRGPKDGALIRLADSPEDIEGGLRRKIELFLGEQFFAGFAPITDFKKMKRPGTLPTLKEFRREVR